MKKLDRRRFLAVSGAAALTGVRTASAAPDFTFRLAHVNNVEHPLHVYIQKAADRIRQESNGRLNILVFPNSQLGGASDLLSQVRTGGVDMIFDSIVTLSSFVPVIATCGIGFAFKDDAAAWKALDGRLGEYSRQAISKARLRVMSKSWAGGFRHIASGVRDIVDAKDIKGLKIRVPVSPLWVSTFEGLGAAPVGLNSSETYTALQTKVIDGVDMSIAGVDTFKYYEVQKNLSLTYHMFDAHYLLANPGSWDRLPKDLQEIASRAFDDTALLEREAVAKENVVMIDRLKSKGMHVSSPDIESFRAALRASGYYARWREKFGEEAWGVLEEAAGKLT
jgi:tripartite ATP-independent transporter DctP family solute receptor